MPTQAQGQPWLVARDDHPWDVYASGVRLIALRALGDPAAADDIAQEAIVRAMSALAMGRAESIGNLRAFLYGIARHLIADAARAANRTIPLQAVPEPIAPSPDALHLAVAAEDRARVRAAIHALSDRDRALLELFFVDELDADAVAARLGDTPVNIRKRKSRALERVRRALGGHDLASAPTES